jgi:hypothetical protein
MHDALTVSLHGALCRSEFVRDLFIDVTPYYELKHLSLTRGQARQTDAMAVNRDLRGT